MTNEEYGVKLEFHTGVNLTNATSGILIYTKPDATYQERALNFDDYINGIVSYINVLGDFDLPGRYYYSIRIIFSNKILESRTEEFKITKSLHQP